MQENGNHEGPGEEAVFFAEEHTLTDEGRPAPTGTHSRVLSGYAKEYRDRFLKHYDELKWLYCELYQNRMDGFEALCSMMYRYYQNRKKDLKALDEKRLEEPDWYKGNRLVGMMLYVDAFAGNLEGVRKKLDYIEECGVNYVHLMPFLDSPEADNDGGYAVSDFRKVKPALGTMEQLSRLADDCRKRGISLCMDFVMNHTSQEHEWAKRARAGEKEYQERYYFYDDYGIPAEFEKTVPQVFPTTAPGNFTWLADMGKFVMTSFYPYQWDLNYWNLAVFHDMMDNALNLINQGIDVVRIDAVPYIWKQLGTNCRNLPQVHSIVRMMRMICEIVCPGVLLLGEVVMAPDKVAPYFGTVERPECHMLYNVTTMASTWSSVAARDARLLKRQMDILSRLPREYVFLNYLRCHDDIGWGLDYPWLATLGMGEVSHKKYLNDFFTGCVPGSFARGELYNSDPASGDARLCGTTASLCGVEKARVEQDEAALERAIWLDLMLHAYMFTQSGIPVIYSGDEIGQENDYSYHEDPVKREDSRYLHRGKFRWDLETKRADKDSLQARLFDEIGRLEKIRGSHPVFESDADVWTADTWEDSVLCVIRAKGEEKLVALFNFSEWDKTAWINEDDGEYEDLISGRTMEAKGVNIPGYGVYWLLKK
ncbi:MAG: amylosucrase [Lachnospiraceae bacterium]|jgi:amylosucrase|nr:amylosucrase [Lachnospiraceae bacterium]